MEVNNTTPFAALTVGQAIELIKNIVRSESNQPQNNESKFIDVDECTKLTGYSKSSIYKKVHHKGIPHHKRDGRLIFLREEIEAWLLSNKVFTREELIEQREADFLKSKRK